MYTDIHIEEAWTEGKILKELDTDAYCHNWFLTLHTHTPHTGQYANCMKRCTLIRIQDKKCIMFMCAIIQQLERIKRNCNKEI